VVIRHHQQKQHKSYPKHSPKECVVVHTMMLDRAVCPKLFSEIPVKPDERAETSIR
jgi:hypothetical protein